MVLLFVLFSLTNRGRLNLLGMLPRRDRLFHIFILATLSLIVTIDLSYSLSSSLLAGISFFIPSHRRTRWSWGYVDFFPFYLGQPSSCSSTVSYYGTKACTSSSVYKTLATTSHWTLVYYLNPAWFYCSLNHSVQAVGPPGFLLRLLCIGCLLVWRWLCSRMHLWWPAKRTMKNGPLHSGKRIGSRRTLKRTKMNDWFYLHNFVVFVFRWEFNNSLC